jgi:hypothetical protein
MRAIAQRRPSVLTINDLAAYFQLDAQLLSIPIGRTRLVEAHDGVIVPYFDEHWNQLGKHRVRIALKGDNRFLWRGYGAIHPYGLQYLGHWRSLRYPLLFVEGESDCWAAWNNFGFPALGIPGATQTKCLRRVHVEGFDKVYVLREPDDGGRVFVSRIAERLSVIGFNGEAFELRLNGCKDLADLHRRSVDRFNIELRVAIGEARPLPLPKVETRQYRGAPRQNAKKFLSSILRDGDWRSVSEIMNIAREARIADITLRRAKKALGVESRLVGFQGRWQWRLPQAMQRLVA